MRFLRVLVVGPCGVVAVTTLAAAAAFLLFQAWWLLAYAVGAGLVACGLVLAVTRRHFWLLGAGALLLAASVGVRFAWARSPANSPVTSWRIGVTAPHEAGALLPERDFLLVASQLLPRLWGWPPGAADDGSLADVVLAQYDALDTDPSTRGLESVVLAQALGERQVAGQYFLVLPKGSPPSGGFPAVLFLHGFAGNYQLYASWFRAIADERGIAAVLPSGTFKGSWWLPDEQQIALKALEDAVRSHGIDPKRVIVGGMSNGGVGACALAARPEFAALLAIAAFPPIDEATGGIGGKPAVFIGGAHDDRFPLDGIHAAMEAYRKKGSAVDSVETDGDHLAIVRDPGLLGTAIERLCSLGPKLCK